MQSSKIRDAQRIFRNTSARTASLAAIRTLVRKGVQKACVLAARGQQSAVKDTVELRLEIPLDIRKDQKVNIEFHHLLYIKSLKRKTCSL